MEARNEPIEKTQQELNEKTEYSTRRTECSTTVSSKVSSEVPEIPAAVVQAKAEAGTILVSLVTGSLSCGGTEDWGQGVQQD